MPSGLTLPGNRTAAADARLAMQNHALQADATQSRMTSAEPIESRALDLTNAEARTISQTTHADILLQNISLLAGGADAFRERYHVDLNTSTFRRPGAHQAAHAVLHFLLVVVDPGDGAASFAHCYPVLDKAQERDFRRLVDSKLVALEKQKLLPLGTARKTIVQSAGGDRFEVLVSCLSTVALKQLSSRHPAQHLTQSLVIPVRNAYNSSPANYAKHLRTRIAAERAVFARTGQVGHGSAERWQKEESALRERLEAYKAHADHLRRLLAKESTVRESRPANADPQPLHGRPRAPAEASKDAMTDRSNLTQLFEYEAETSQLREQVERALNPSSAQSIVAPSSHEHEPLDIVQLMAETTQRLRTATALIKSGLSATTLAPSSHSSATHTSASSASLPRQPSPTGDAHAADDQGVARRDSSAVDSSFVSAESISSTESFEPSESELPLAPTAESDIRASSTPVSSSGGFLETDVPEVADPAADATVANSCADEDVDVEIDDESDEPIPTPASDSFLLETEPGKAITQSLNTHRAVVQSTEQLTALARETATSAAADTKQVSTGSSDPRAPPNEGEDEDEDSYEEEPNIEVSDTDDLRDSTLKSGVEVPSQFATVVYDEDDEAESCTVMTIEAGQRDIVVRSSDASKSPSEAEKTAKEATAASTAQVGLVASLRTLREAADAQDRQKRLHGRGEDQTSDGSTMEETTSASSWLVTDVEAHGPSSASSGKAGSSGSSDSWAAKQSKPLVSVLSTSSSSSARAAARGPKAVRFARLPPSSGGSSRRRSSRRDADGTRSSRSEASQRAEPVTSDEVAEGAVLRGASSYEPAALEAVDTPAADADSRTRSFIVSVDVDGLPVDHGQGVAACDAGTRAQDEDDGCKPAATSQDTLASEGTKPVREERLNETSSSERKLAPRYISPSSPAATGAVEGDASAPTTGAPTTGAPRRKLERKNTPRRLGRLLVPRSGSDGSATRGDSSEAGAQAVEQAPQSQATDPAAQDTVVKPDSATRDVSETTPAASPDAAASDARDPAQSADVVDEFDHGGTSGDAFRSSGSLYSSRKLASTLTDLRRSVSTDFDAGHLRSEGTRRREARMASFSAQEARDSANATDTPPRPADTQAAPAMEKRAASDILARASSAEDDADAATYASLATTRATGSMLQERAGPTRRATSRARSSGRGDSHAPGAAPQTPRSRIKSLRDRIKRLA